MSALDPKSFKAALSRFASGVTVITLKDAEGQDHGMTASAFSSLSIDPPLVLVCVQNKAHTCELLKAAGAFSVNILSEEQKHLSNRFAGMTGETDRWGDLELSRGPVSGAAWIGGALARLDCTLHSQLPGGDHTIFVGEVHHLDYQEEMYPLIYWRGYHRLPHD